MKSASLLYHDVLSPDRPVSGFPGGAASSYKLDEPSFRAHLERLGGVRDSTVALIDEELGPPAALPSGGAASTRIYLTFDDGGESAHGVIADLLEKRGWRGHFFVVTERIGDTGFLSREQIRDLHRRGHHIGSHSHSHPSQFSRLSYDQMLHEWRRSREILGEVLGSAPISVSVPGGFYSRRVALSAREAGYTVLFNSEPTSRTGRLGNLLIVGRFGVKGDTSAQVAASLAAGDPWLRARQAVSWNVKKPLKRFGGPVWFRLRHWIFERSART